MCNCSKTTVIDIVDMTNRIRARKGLNPLPYSYVLKGWHGLVSGYCGKRNPYAASGRIGLNYTFTAFRARKIARKISSMRYNGRSDSLGYQYWWKAA